MDDISELQERVASDESEITLLRGQIDRERAKRMELKHKIQRLKKDLERHKSDIENLRADVAHQCDHYNELQKGHGELLMEA